MEYLRKDLLIKDLTALRKNAVGYEYSILTKVLDLVNYYEVVSLEDVVNSTVQEYTAENFCFSKLP